jgi:hypothetical protein
MIVLFGDMSTTDPFLVGDMSTTDPFLVGDMSTTDPCFVGDMTKTDPVLVSDMTGDHSAGQIARQIAPQRPNSTHLRLQAAQPLLEELRCLVCRRPYSRLSRSKAMPNSQPGQFGNALKK